MKGHSLDPSFCCVKSTFSGWRPEAVIGTSQKCNTSRHFWPVQPTAVAPHSQNCNISRHFWLVGPPAAAPHSQKCNTSQHFWLVRPPAGIRIVWSVPWGLFGPPWASLEASWSRLGPCWAHLGAPLDLNYQFSYSFSTFWAGRRWAYLGALFASVGILGTLWGPS